MLPLIKLQKLNNWYFSEIGYLLEELYHHTEDEEKQQMIEDIAIKLIIFVEEHGDVDYER